MSYCTARACVSVEFQLKWTDSWEKSGGHRRAADTHSIPWDWSNGSTLYNTAWQHTAWWKIVKEAGRYRTHKNTHSHHSASKHTHTQMMTVLHTLMNPLWLQFCFEGSSTWLLGVECLYMHLLQIGYLTLCMTAPLEPKLLNVVIVRLIESILLPPEVYCVHKFLGLLIIVASHFCPLIPQRVYKMSLSCDVGSPSPGEQMFLGWEFAWFLHGISTDAISLLWSWTKSNV